LQREKAHHDGTTLKEAGVKLGLMTAEQVCARRTDNRSRIVIRSFLFCGLCYAVIL
jgi:hypothetical protein